MTITTYDYGVFMYVVDKTKVNTSSERENHSTDIVYKKADINIKIRDLHDR